jgi:hypothetical protein
MASNERLSRAWRAVLEYFGLANAEAAAGRLSVEARSEARALLVLAGQKHRAASQFSAVGLVSEALPIAVVGFKVAGRIRWVPPARGRVGGVAVRTPVSEPARAGPSTRRRARPPPLSCRCTRARSRRPTRRRSPSASPRRPRCDLPARPCAGRRPAGDSALDPQVPRRRRRARRPGFLAVARRPAQ